MTFDETVTDVPLEKFFASLNTANFWSYDGGLTTPPCTEGVKWTVLQGAAPISPSNLLSLKARYAGDASFAPCADEGGECTGGNNRMTMPKNDRYIYNNYSRSSAGAIETAALSVMTVGVMMASLTY
jgi:carbonic anhydrase